MDHVSTKDLRHRELKVRLNDADYALIDQLATRTGIPKAVIGLSFIRHGLERASGAVSAVALTDGRPA